MHHVQFWTVLDGGSVGPLATINREPGQARKGAAVAVTLCAGVWLAGPPPYLAYKTLLSDDNSLLRSMDKRAGFP